MFVVLCFFAAVMVVVIVVFLDKLDKIGHSDYLHPAVDAFRNGIYPLIALASGINEDIGFVYLYYVLCRGLEGMRVLPAF